MENEWIICVDFFLIIILLELQLPLRKGDVLVCPRQKSLFINIWPPEYRDWPIRIKYSTVLSDKYFHRTKKSSMNILQKRLISVPYGWKKITGMEHRQLGFETVYIHIYLSSFPSVVLFNIYQHFGLWSVERKGDCSSQDARRSFWEKSSFQRERDELPIEREV